MEPTRREFLQNFKEAGGEVVGGESIMMAIRKTLEAFGKSEGVFKLLVTGSTLPYLPDQLPPGGKLEDLRSVDLSDLKRVGKGDIGLGMAVALIADTGSLVVPWSNWEEAYVSTIPDIFLCIAPQAPLFTNLREFLVKTPPHSSYTLITGPSRTADIEKRLVMGAHGPLRVILVLDWSGMENEDLQAL